MSDVARDWDRILAWHRARVSADYLAGTWPAYRRAGPGVTEAQIDATERALGVRLPDSVREMYRLSDGTGDYAVFPYGRYLLSLEGVVRDWRLMTDATSEVPGYATTPEGPIRPVFWSRGWIPVTDNCGYHDCVDLDPATGGVVGQVIDYADEGPIRVQAPDFGEWLRQYANALEDGQYRYDPDGCWVVATEALDWRRSSS